MSITKKAHRVRDKIAEAAVRSGRTPDDVTLVAVTKTRSVEEITEVIDAGVTHLGENRVQEAASKIPSILSDTVTWHLIGHLQSNKVKLATPLFSWIDSIDSRKIVDILNRRAVEEEKKLNVLVQVNISGEMSKSGVMPEDTKDIVSYASKCEGLVVKGLLTIGSLDADQEQTRDEFKRMKDLFDRLGEDKDIGGMMQVLSMGMSGDYITAIEEGSTMVRIGTSIFGVR